MSDASDFANALRQFKTEWEAGRQPVTIPRAQHEALRAAAKAWAADNPVRNGCDCEQCNLRRPVHAALRAAGIQTEDRPND